jgi:hypothetical protein
MVASRPARVRWLNPSVSSGRNGSAVVLAASAASSCRHRQSSVATAASRLSSCCWKIRAARPRWAGPVSRRSLGSTWVAARHTCTSAISSAGTVARARSARPSPSAVRRTWSASWATRRERAPKYGPHVGSAAMRLGMPGSHGSGPSRPLSSRCSRGASPGRRLGRRRCLALWLRMPPAGSGPVSGLWRDPRRGEIRLSGPPSGSSPGTTSG